MHPALLRLMPHEVLVAPLAAESGGGARSYGADRRVKARVEPDQRMVRDRTGREVASSSVAFLMPTDVEGVALALRLDDRITLPAGFVPRTPPIISMQPRYGLGSTVDHYEVRL